jgi:hypothetical protein
MKAMLTYRADGSIMQYIQCLEHELDIQGVPEGGGALMLDEMPADVMAHSQNYWVPDGSIQPRKAMPIKVGKIDLKADGVDEAAITGIPHGAMAWTSGATTSGPHEITDGELVITTNKPGQIWIAILHAGFIDFGVVLYAS